MDKQLIAVVSGADTDEIEFVGLRSEALHYINAHGKTGWKLRYAANDGNGLYSLGVVIEWSAYERRFAPLNGLEGRWDDATD